MTTTLQYKDKEQEDFPVTMRTINHELAEEVARDVEEFLASGGEIEQIEAGLCSEEYRKKMNQQEARDYMKKTGGRKNTKDSRGCKLSPWHAIGEANFQDYQENSSAENAEENDYGE